MNFESILFRLKRLIFPVLRNPLLFFKIFNIKKLLKALYGLSNVQVSFKALKKDFQITTLFNTLEKINLISDKNLTKNNFFN
jgi:hypothetical protein